MNETIRVIMNRRSVRSFKKQPVGQQEKDTVLHAALRAPTAGNMMLYSVIDVEDQRKKDELAVLCDHQPFIAQAPMVLLFLADMQKWYDLFRISGVPELAGEKGLDFQPPGEADLMLSCCDALIAAQTSVIAAESLGIGSCYIGDILENYETVRELFSLPPYTFPITLVCYGYPKNPGAENRSTRCAVEDIVFTDTYREKTAEQLQGMHRPMIERYFPKGNYYQDAANIGQHYFLRKYSSSFMAEMNRSVHSALRTWRKAETVSGDQAD